MSGLPPYRTEFNGLGCNSPYGTNLRMNAGWTPSREKCAQTHDNSLRVKLGHKPKQIEMHPSQRKRKLAKLAAE